MKNTEKHSVLIRLSSVPIYSIFLRRQSVSMVISEDVVGIIRNMMAQFPTIWKEKF